MTIKAAPHCCEEASTLSTEVYLPCNAPATRIVQSTDRPEPYRMCAWCAEINVRRGLIDVGPYLKEAVSS